MKRPALVEGNPKSAVRVVEYEDLQCSDCAAYRKMMDEQLLPRFGSIVAFEHRDFPLAKHPWARKAAVAARFLDAHSPAVGVEFRRMVMANLTAIDPENFNERLSEFAGKHGIEPASAISALEHSTFVRLVEDDYQDGIARGVSKTPTVFVNGEPFIERFEFDEIARAIYAELGAVQR